MCCNPTADIIISCHSQTSRQWIDLLVASSLEKLLRIDLNCSPIVLLLENRSVSGPQQQQQQHIIILGSVNTPQQPPPRQSGNTHFAWTHSESSNSQGRFHSRTNNTSCCCKRTKVKEKKSTQVHQSLQNGSRSTHKSHKPLQNWSRSTSQRVNQHPLHREGWMVSDEETGLCWVPNSLANLFFGLITYLLTTCLWIISR